MFSAKQLSKEQILNITTWAAEGTQLPDIQLRMREEMQFPVTYMETRFLILDLGIELITEVVEQAPAIEVEPSPPIPALGETLVTMDSFALPGSAVSGRVTFSDGQGGIWQLDETGRPSLDPDTEGYQPTHEDIIEFQKQLRALIEKSGL